MFSVSQQKHEDLKHVVRAVRENVGIFKSELDNTGKTNRDNVAATLGIVETLKLFDIYPGVESEVSALSQWLWLGKEWKELKIEEERVHA